LTAPLFQNKLTVMDREQHENARPLYQDFAWIYDSIFGPPREAIVAKITHEFEAHRIEPGSLILDAGCGTGGYVVALSERGFRVTGIDCSRELLGLAEQKARRVGALATFRVADLRRDRLDGPYDAVLARGVLNDFVTDSDRNAVVASVGGALRLGGVLIADVRDWKRSRQRFARESTFEKSASIDGAEVRFRSETQVDDATRQLRIREGITVIENGQRRDAENDFAMRCWSVPELRSRLGAAGFQDVETRRADRSDRILVIATR
jgi:SAM-dependent methyltransferase